MLFLPVAGEKIIGARAWRVLFAGVSLPLAVVPIVYFINHRYSGTPLWNIREVPYVHDGVWWASLVSFFFLYPSTFNLLEVRHHHSHRPLSCQFLGARRITYRTSPRPNPGDNHYN